MAKQQYVKSIDSIIAIDNINTPKITNSGLRDLCQKLVRQG